MLKKPETDADRLRLVQMRYNNGIASSLDLLDAERSSYAAELALAQTRQLMLNNRIDLYKVLGGGLVASTGQPAAVVPAGSASAASAVQ